MFALIMMVIFAIVIGVGAFMWARTDLKLIGMIVAGVGAFLLVVTLFFSCTYTQDPGQARVLRSWTGEVEGIDTNPGFAFKSPMTSLIEYDVRNQTVTFANGGDNNDGPAIIAQDKNGASATIDVVVRYSLVPGSVDRIYKEYATQENFEKRLIFNDVRSVIRDIPVKYTTSEFRLNREKAAIDMRLALENRWKNSGLIVETVDLRNISYPESIEKSLQQVQEATNNANKARAELESAKIKAEEARVRAQGDADADQIIRCGAKSTEVDEVINGQPMKVKKVTPLLGAECQNRLNEQVLTSKYIDALKEIGQKGNMVVVPQGSMPMIQVPGSAKPQ